MKKGALFTEPVFKLLIFVAGAIVVISAFVIINQKLQGPVKAEGLRTKVELATANKNYLQGVSAPVDVFRCGTERVYWKENTIEGVADEINKVMAKVHYSYGADGDEHLDFFSDWMAIWDPVNICYVCTIASNNKDFGPTRKFDDLLHSKSFFVEERSGTETQLFSPFFGLDERRSINSPRFIKIGPEDLLFMGYSVLKFKEGGSIKPASGSLGRAFVLNQEDLTSFCKDQLLIDNV